MLVLVVYIACADELSAIAPAYIGDRELAASPIIVVARWNKADFQSHHRYEADEELGLVITEVEQCTTLEVLRSIEGNVKVGHDFPYDVAASSTAWQTVDRQRAAMRHLSDVGT